MDGEDLKAAAGEQAGYESGTLAELTVARFGGDPYQFKGVRIALLAGGALKVYRDRSFSDDVPFEHVFPRDRWAEYHAFPA